MLKRMLRRRWPILLLLLAPLLPLWRAVFTGQAIGAFDQVHQFAPWNGPAPERPWDVLQADGVLQFYVWRDMVFEAWGKGQLPFWNPYSLAGYPLLANSQSAGFYPPHILLGILHVPTSFGMLLLAWLHLAWAGLGTYMLVRRLGGTKLGGWLAGASFALSPFMIAWTGLPSVITTVSWIPWILACIAGLFLSHPLVRSVERTLSNSGPHDPHQYAIEQIGWRRAHLRLIAGLMACTAMLILSGHLQFVAYGVMAALLFAVVLAFMVPRLRPTTIHVQVGHEGVDRRTPSKAGWWMQPSVLAAMSTLVAIAVGALIAAPQLLPVLQYSQFSHRRTPPTSVGYGAYIGGAIRPFELETLPFATLLGNPSHAADLPAEAHWPKLSTYWPVHVKGGANFAESAISLGPLVLTLLFLAPWRRMGRRLAPIAAVGLVALLLATGTPLNMVLYYVVPGWSATGSPGRVGVLFLLAACVIAGLSVDRLPVRPADGLRRLVPVLLPVFLAIVFVGVASRLVPADMTPLASLISGQAFNDAAPLLLVALVVAVLATMAAYDSAKTPNRIAILAAPLVLFALAGGLELIPTGDPSFLATAPIKPADPTARVAVVNDGWSIPAAVHALAPPNTLAAARIHDLAGYDSLIHRDTVAMLAGVDGGKDPATEANGNMMFVKPKADPHAVADAGVTELWSLHELPQFGQASFDGALYHYAVPGPGRASTPGGPAKIESESPSQIVVTANGPGPLVLRDRNFPGWFAKVDGRHVPIAGTTWREIDLPAGPHRVEFNYVPPGFMPGLALGLLGIMALLAVFLPTVKRLSGVAPTAEPQLEAK